MPTLRFALLIATVALMVGCDSAPVVYAPGDMIEDGATGSVEALPVLLKGNNLPIRLIFVHGVGDHCYGYALGDTGWLGDKARKALGLVALNAIDHDHVIPIDIFMDGPKDPHAYVEYTNRQYQFRADSAMPGLKVEAIEITWSHLTQWIKTTQLSYDSASVFSTQSRTECLDPPDPALVPDIKPPPARLLLDRIIKEQTFDRNLADSIIYAGTYGPVIERGLAEALCHAITHQADDQRCSWPSEKTDPHQYIFVTHSLGSRILYDTLLNLMGYDPFDKGNPFATGRLEAKDVLTQAKPFIGDMISHTQAIYMMANQVSLMGLADVPPGARSTAGVQPFMDTAVRPIPSEPDVLRSCHNVTTKLARARDLEISRRGLLEPALHLVAFNDTNDLLTWHIPQWYTNEAGNDCRPSVQLANVFVKNAAHLLIFESPGSAHHDYFTNEDVWKVIACGARAGALDRCP